MKEVQESISSIDDQLKSGAKIMNEMNEIRKNFIENKNLLISYQLSGSELLNEIERISDLANSMDIDIKNLEIDPRNTFPDLNQTMGKDQIELERNSLNFQLSGNFIDVGNFIVNNSKLRKLGWSPKIPINIGIKKTLDYFQSN